MNSNTATTIKASDIRPGMTIATIPSIAGGSVTVTTVTVTDVEPYDIAGRTFYDLHHDRGIVTNMTGEYHLIAGF